MPHRLFLVEDEPVIAAGIVRKLQQLGYLVTGQSGNGESALRMIDSSPPDLVLMDIKLEGRMDGIEVASQIRKRHDVPIVFLTAYADEATIKRATEQDPFGYIVKPFTDRELSGAIEVALHRHALDRETRSRAERYRMLSEVLSDYAFAIGIAADPENDSLIWSAGSAESVFGAGLRKFRTIDDAMPLIHPDDAPSVIEFWQRVRTGTDGRIEFRVVSGDGALRWLKMDARVVRSRDGSVEQVYGAYQDITALRATQDRIPDRGFDFSQIVQTMPHGIWVGDSEGVCIYVNQALCDLTGRPRDHLVGQRSLPAIVVDAPVEADPAEPFEGDLLVRSGESIPVLVSPRRLGGENGSVGSFFVLTDMSAQRRAMDEIERGRRKLQGVFRVSPAPSILIDSATNTILDVNEAFVRTLGFSAEDIVGTGSFGLADHSNLADLNQMVAILKERSTQSSKLRFRTHDGRAELFDVEIRDIVVRDEEALLLILNPSR